jgi:hypothetical protein
MATQFEMVGTEFGTRIVSGLFSKLAPPAAARTDKSKPKRDEPDVDIELGCSNLMMKGLLATNETRKYQLTRKGEDRSLLFSYAYLLSCTLSKQKNTTIKKTHAHTDKH